MRQNCHLITRCHVSLASQTSTSLRAARNPTHNHCSSSQRRVWPNGRLDLSNTGWEPNIGINVSAEHTPIHMPSDSFNENATIAASDEFAPRQRVESSSRHSNTVEFGTTHSLQELWRSNNSVSGSFCNLTGNSTETGNQPCVNC